LEKLILLLFLIPPAFFFISAVGSAFAPGQKAKPIIQISLVAALFSVLASVTGAFFVANNGVFQSDLWGFEGLGLSIRLDSISLLMFGMISILSFVILKFSVNYLEGDERQGLFIGRLSGTLSAVQLLVISGNLFQLVLAWVVTSVMLHYLLVFYAERRGAQIAAKKKFIMARLGDVSFIAAAYFLYESAGSGNLEEIFNWLKSTNVSSLVFTEFELPVMLLLITAFLKSAQFPTHGWLVEVMETPTPVSALLHAGLLNAGPFLVIRMAYLIEASAYASYILLIVGALSAVFGSVVYMTQPSVKTALGYSSIAHMGFSFMVSGLGVFSASMLHLVGHSFYKAHAFLSSGSAIDLIRASRFKKVKGSLNFVKAISGVLAAIAVYSLTVFLFQVDLTQQFAFIALGMVIILGLSRVFAETFSSGNKLGLIFQSLIMALTISFSFFFFESLMSHLITGQVPEISGASSGKYFTIGAIIAVFSLIVVLQMVAPRLRKRAFFLKLGIHLRNGLYANALFDRMIKALSIESESYSFVTGKRVDMDTKQIEKEEMAMS
jgi:NAD(P)H-quinone oxidoreductase subunit 5